MLDERHLRPAAVEERRAVVERARELGLEVIQPAKIRTAEFLDHIRAARPDLGVVIAYGRILPGALLEIPAHGFINVHGSVLPAWRGAAPIQRAILAGDHVTGVTIMQMERGLDTGPMLASARVPVEDKTSGELHAELAEIGARLMGDTLAQLDQLKPQPQRRERKPLCHPP